MSATKTLLLPFEQYSHADRSILFKRGKPSSSNHRRQIRVLNIVFLGNPEEKCSCLIGSMMGENLHIQR